MILYIYKINIVENMILNIKVVILNYIQLILFIKISIINLKIINQVNIHLEIQKILSNKILLSITITKQKSININQKLKDYYYKFKIYKLIKSIIILI
jgi:hypothetical protein